MRRSRVESQDFSDWRRALQQFFPAAEPCSRDAERFFGRVENCRIGSLDIVLVSATLQNIRLLQGARDPEPSVIVNLSMDVLDLCQMGQRLSLSEGEAAVMAGTEDEVITPIVWLNALFFRFGPRFLPGPLDRLIGRKLARDTDALRLLLVQANALNGLHEIGDPVTSHELGRHLGSLLRLAILGSMQPPDRPTGKRRLALEDLLRTLEECHADPAFSVSNLAERHRVSTRFVQTVLQETGRTFSERLMELRLERAFALLQDGRNAGRKISDIAFACGFADVSYFHRRFRERFGMSAGRTRPTD